MHYTLRDKIHSAQLNDFRHEEYAADQVVYDTIEDHEARIMALEQIIRNMAQMLATNNEYRSNIDD